MIVCVCNNVSEGDIAREIADGCTSYAQLQERLGVAVACGCCGSCAQQSFEKEAQAAQQPRTFYRGRFGERVAAQGHAVMRLVEPQPVRARSR
ncbi:MAG: (2Fe-2S)-binding protein [Steroidobacteraceae bacterium]